MTLVAPAPAQAATSCSGARLHYHDGYATTTQITVGASAIIKTKSPTLCTGGASTYSNAFSLLTGPANTGAGWAQTGYIRDKLNLNGALSGFSQQVRLYGLIPVTKYFPAPAQDSTHSYQSFQLATGFIGLYIDANRVDTTSWKPTENWAPQPWSSQYSGETGHCQSDMPGLAVTKAHFTNVTILQFGSWVAPGTMTSVLDCGTKYAHAIVNATALDIWTANP
jgi:hypothetical protein